MLDEIGRGTSTYDGVSIAWSVAEHIHDAIGCKTLFVTHYCAALSESRPRVGVYAVWPHNAQRAALSARFIAFLADPIARLFAPPPGSEARAPFDRRERRLTPARA